ncbi:biosynthetic-type acetolactate synthase large subunit [Sulfobacillus thermosulfidooxidans]|uniref:biosynthetic-type acetolactate synthase large subunit n=1 Tax=Sulfobacillus thermosulfidooxidans TaxID=28034 RepID=UPI0006B5A4A1|nr:biosynthetic-type acetolactate synthase large subunit [Sulfobacillus thermosulfidooxidans]
MTGAELTWEVLSRLGTTVVFGVPGGAILPLVDALATRQNDPIEFVVSRHEAASIHAADGYARVTGKPAIVLATSGPGGTNVITGLVTAMTDSVPIVLVLGQVPTTLIGTDAFQEADLFSMTMPVVKHSWRITEPQEVADVLLQAWETARSGRPGPVVVEFPKNIQFMQCPEWKGLPATNASEIEWEEKPITWARAKSYLRSASRPLLYVGGGVVSSGTQDYVMQFAETYDCPVAHTLMGIGAFPSTHPKALGMLGMHGTWYANNAMQHADLVIALGARFDDRVTGKLDEFAPNARIIHVDVDAAELSKLVRPNVAIHGDLRRVLPKMLKIVPNTTHSEWWDTINQWKASHPLRINPAPEGTIASPAVMQVINRHLRPDDIVVTEVGQHQMWGALFLRREKPRTFLTSGGAGTMGYGFPAAMGAQFAAGNNRVILIAGDGSFQMNLQELATVVQYNIPIWMIVLNNEGHGMVRQWQDLFHGKRRIGVDLVNPDFVRLAESFGIHGFSVNSEEALDEALRIMESINGPVLLEVMVPKDEHVFPMVPAGQPLSMVLEG